MDSVGKPTLTVTQLINQFTSNSYELKSTIESYPKEVKGNIFEELIAELYRGNGWLANVVGGRNDGGADILLYLPSSPNVVSFIIQTKNHAKPLTYDETKIELIKFEEKGKQKYNCSNYKLIATNGFVKEAEKLERFNMGLTGWQYIEELIESYGKHKEPHLELLAHNKIAFQNTEKLFKDNKRVCVVQATGTGKRFIIGKLLLSHIKEDCLFVSPSSHINNQQELLLPFLKNVKYITYQSLLGKSDKQLEELNADLIIFDEFHRLGASEWNAAANRLLTIKNSSKVFGATATHIRYLDNNRNMAKELFGNVISNQLPLEEAIVRKILPSPKYICSLYDISKPLSDANNRIYSSKETDQNKSKLYTQINKAKVDWENASGVPSIFSKYLDDINGKYMIFCEDKYHLSDMVEEVRKWFKKTARIKKLGVIEPEHYVIHSGMSTIDITDTLKKFESAKPQNKVHLMFSINMFNEGLHLKNVNRIILLRRTLSPLIYFQQIGRCLKTDSESEPIIFDLVNNTESIKADNIKDTFANSLVKENEIRQKFKLPQVANQIHIFDETKNILTALDNINSRLTNFEVGFSYLTNYFKTHKTSKVQQGYTLSKTNFPLGLWCSAQREKYKQGKLKDEQIDKLNTVNFIWDTYQDMWNEGYILLTEYSAKKGNSDVIASYIDKDSKFLLGNWCFAQRAAYKQNRLSSEKVRKLESVGFTWSKQDKNWITGITALEEFVLKNGHCNVHQSTNDESFNLGGWCSERRKNYKKGKLSKDRIEQMENLGFKWDPTDDYWQECYKEIKLFFNQKGHSTVKQKYNSPDSGFPLGNWCSSQRQHYKKSTLSNERIAMLNKLKFIWSTSDMLWEEGISFLKEYQKENGNCNVPPKYTYPGTEFNLGAWCNSRRTNLRKGNLDLKRVEELKKLGFIFEPLQQSWEFGFKELVKFKDEFGNCDVPYKYITIETKFNLYQWCNTQRQKYNKETLGKEKVKLLDNHQFIWDKQKYTYDKMWKIGYSEFIKYKRKFGTIDVPSGYIDKESNFNLTNWVKLQRHNYSQKKIDREKITRLEKHGFIWRKTKQKAS